MSLFLPQRKLAKTHSLLTSAIDLGMARAPEYLGFYLSV